MTTLALCKSEESRALGRRRLLAHCTCHLYQLTACVVQSGTKPTFATEVQFCETQAVPAQLLGPHSGAKLCAATACVAQDRYFAIKFSFAQLCAIRAVTW